jgi:hypothetical protein
LEGFADKLPVHYQCREIFYFFLDRTKNTFKALLL